jgi:integrase/recombinase XerD
MPSLGDLLEDFLSDPQLRLRLRPATLRAYRVDLRAAAAALTQPLDTITAADIVLFLGQAAAASTTNRRIASLRRFFAWAIDEGLCAHNPLDRVNLACAPHRLPRPIRADADRRAVDQAIAHAPQPFRLALTILRETGMRAGEVLALNLADVALDAGREALHVRDAKNRTERMVVLGPTATPKSVRALRAALRERTREPGHSPLLRSNRSTRLSYDALHYQWGQCCLAAGLVDDVGKPRYTLHQLRHTRATELVEQGQRIEIVQRVLGHRDPRSTQGYAELHEAQVRAALEQV